MRTLKLMIASSLLSLLLIPAQAMAGALYEVTVTNLTKGQFFTPLLMATHNSRNNLFEPGKSASVEMESIAEGGDIGPMKSRLEALSFDVMDIQSTAGLLAPGDSVTVIIEGDHIFDRLSVTGMLIPTNDTFVGVDRTRLANWKRLSVPAYDAGTEMNDELCASIPGPVCGGEGNSADGGEGFIYVSNGISGKGDLAASAYDWRNPVAQITISRIPR